VADKNVRRTGYCEVADSSIEKDIVSKLVELCRGYDIEDSSVILEIPKIREYGELSCNIALTSARATGMKPVEFAERLAEQFPTSIDGVEEVTVAGPGFLNFRLSPEYLQRLMKNIAADPEHFGSSDEGQGERWLFEFVSANPTGPLNVVSARAASVGDTLVRVFKKRGYDAQSEYYVNDGGNQIRLLGASVRARIENVEIPEGGYHGEYLLEYAERFVQYWEQSHSSTNYPDDDGVLGRYIADMILGEQEKTLEGFKVKFDLWFRESSLYDEAVKGVISKLRQRNQVYSQDGALYFKASEFGDGEDRVIETSKGAYTYVVPDSAYHLNKYDRGFQRAVNLLGPDHHGHIRSLTAALRALEMPEDFFRPILVQQVNLKRGGEEIRMSKRAGVGITLDELIEEVGVDAARYFFLMRKVSSHLDFDMDLARKHTDENPVYYVQYAYARIRSILRQPGAEKVPHLRDADLDCLNTPEELDLMKSMARFPWTLASIVRSVEPHPLTNFLTDLARSFHVFYSRHRVISDDVGTTSARLVLCIAVAGVLMEGMELMGVTAPVEPM